MQPLVVLAELFPSLLVQTASCVAGDCMLTKHCRKVLDSILSLPTHQHFGAFRLVDLSAKTGLSFQEVLSACKELDKDGLAELRIIHIMDIQQIPESITLTEPGLNYKAMLRAQRLAYIADKWTDIIACIISIIALIVSIHTALSN